MKEKVDKFKSRYFTQDKWKSFQTPPSCLNPDPVACTSTSCDSIVTSPDADETLDRIFSQVEQHRRGAVAIQVPMRGKGDFPIGPNFIVRNASNFNTPVTRMPTQGPETFSEAERVLAAEMLRFSSETNLQSTEKSQREEQLEEYLSELAGFDLPSVIATDKDVLIETYAHMIVYIPNRAYHSKFTRAYHRQKTTPRAINHVPSVLETISSDDLVECHFAKSLSYSPRVNFSIDKIIEWGIQEEFQQWIQVSISYDILTIEYCLTATRVKKTKPRSKRTVAPTAKTTARKRKRSLGSETSITSDKCSSTKNSQKESQQTKTIPRKKKATIKSKQPVEVAQSSLPKKAKRSYTRKKAKI